MIDIINEVVANPNFIPPENFFELDLSSLGDILESCSEKLCVRFAVGEARLVLPVFEKDFPDDDSPRRALEIVEDWLNNPANAKINISAAAYAARAAAYAARAAEAAAYAAYAAWAAAEAAAYAAYAAWAAAYAAWAAKVDYAATWASHAVGTTIKDFEIEQYKRLFCLLRG